MGFNFGDVLRKIGDVINVIDPQPSQPPYVSGHTFAPGLPEFATDKITQPAPSVIDTLVAGLLERLRGVTRGATDAIVGAAAEGAADAFLSTEVVTRQKRVGVIALVTVGALSILALGIALTR